ncbi:hypothetical protein GCM10010106_18150 [Thermopolyspora flexuosa]|jgi:molybdopterin-guanine dinucleotide biosynthesis protein A|uniref:Probable molybdenum cofactor guanylyltransferase n=1 Tax=Thermopolyspora flexuosa TaxID=103836 RepID=A0A543J442_9ACTN|nr:molybdenum cofactor guanylyltransferase [Thermopolyspora flexuosa]TQM77599.1 molybdopterin-guanine dinucleotide biosynthesis protein A [Thermopolyspora flexuosa]GGM72219.1 hypothetical protein GCM10010106_18150 [Thermopolyspora flexuosa]
MRTAAGVVLAGGRSTRMGTPKAWLDWHGSTLLYRTAAVLRRTVGGPVVVVAAPGQRLPHLPAGVTVTEDPVEGRGPMQGLAVGLAAVADAAETAFVCSTDMPFLHPAFVRRVLRELADSPADLALPVVGGYRQPLAAAYRTSLAGLVADLLAKGDLRPGMLFQHCTVAWLDEPRLLTDPDLAACDPSLESVTNVNTPEDYAAARARPAPPVTVERDDTPVRHSVRAATLAEAATAVGLSPALDIAVRLNGEEVPPDALLPLVAGDHVVFLVADTGGADAAGSPHSRRRRPVDL